MRRVTLMTLGSPGLRAGKSLAFLLALARADPAGAVADEAGRHEDLQQESSDREVEPVRGKPCAGRGEGTAFKATAFETSQWLPWQKPDTIWAWKLVRLRCRSPAQSGVADGGRR